MRDYILLFFHARTTCPDLSVNVCKDLKCLYEHEFLHLLVRLLAVVVDSI
jgi:hypothetical protein